MKTKNYGFLMIMLLIMLFSGLHFACSTSGGMAKAEQTERVYNTLLDRLRYQSELTISGPESSPSIRIRGTTSIEGDNEPLFVVNGNPMGTGYSSVVSAVEVNNVESIRVLTRSQAGIYGARGANGVVVITTK